MANVSYYRRFLVKMKKCLSFRLSSKGERLF